MRRRAGYLQLRHGRAFSGKMDLAQRRLAVGQAEALEHVPGQAFRDGAAHALQQVENHFALPSGCQPRSAQRFVYRRNPPHFEEKGFGILAFFGQDLELGLDHFEIAAGPRGFHLAEYGHRLPGVEAVLEISSVEPQALQRQPSLAQCHFEDRHAAAGPEQCGSAHLRDHAGGLARFQFINAAGILPVFIAKGKMIEEVLGGLDVFLGKLRGHVRAHPAHVFHLAL
jgi:hypothetical protein